MRKILTTIAAGASLVAVRENAVGARDAEALCDLSVQDSMAVEVESTSVARRGQEAKDASAAIFLLSNAKITRSSATTIQELLRYVPDVHVGQVNRYICY